jgi:hypothetical protein
MTRAQPPAASDKSAIGQRAVDGGTWQLVTSRTEYLGVFDALLREVQRELRIFDADAAQLQLNTPARLAGFRDYLARDRNNRFYLVVHSTEAIERGCPRFIELLAQRSEQIEVRKTEGEALRAQDCFVLVDALHVLRRNAQTHPRGVAIRSSPLEAAIMRERFDQLWQSSAATAIVSAMGI